jgi:hypothetical protein
MDGAEGVGLVQDSWTEVDGDPIGRAHLQWMKERERIPFRVLSAWASGWIRGWAELVPYGLFYIFFVSFSFSFFGI